jgi:hypothetical protein
MAIINGVAKSADEGFYPKQIEQSLRFNDDDGAYLSWTPASAGNRKTWTWSGWVKRGNTTSTMRLFNAGSNSGDRTLVLLGSGDTLLIANGVSGVTKGVETVGSVFRDSSAWYHIVATFDSTETTNTDRCKIYVNGIQVPANSLTSGYVGLNDNGQIGNTVIHAVGTESYNLGSNSFDGYLSDVHFTDGTAYDATAFGEFKNGVWVAKNPSGISYGTNGFYLAFDGDVTDSSGNGNDWTANNLASTDYMLDSPTNNFATLNPLTNTDSASVAEGNLKWNGPSSNASRFWSTLVMSSGKYYWEVLQIDTGSDQFNIGVTDIDKCTIMSSDTNDDMGIHPDEWSFLTGGEIRNNNSVASYGSSVATGSIVQIVLDVDNGELYFGKDGTWFNSSDPATNSSPAFDNLTAGNSYLAGIGRQTSGNNAILNFGQDSSFAGNKTPQGYTDANGIGDFYYAPPTGALALCTANLPEPLIGPNSDSTSDEHFNTVLYTGDGTDGHAITGVGYQPDFTWIKSRSEVRNHQLLDAVRGATNYLNSDTTSAEGTSSVTLQSFDSDGFTLGTGGAYNASGQSYVAWNWKANGSGSSNTDGSITSTVSANTDAGFSIVSWTGNSSTATVGHGLSIAPEVIIIKNRTVASGWDSYFAELGNGNKLVLNTTAASASTTLMNNTDPTSSVFSTDAFSTGHDMIAYCFHSSDLIKIGSYTGNGSTDGPFIFTDGRPAFVMVKRTDDIGNWQMFDAERDTDNTVNAGLKANRDFAEDSSAIIYDFLSNGFKIRNTFTDFNASGGTYIYMAFAENPFKYSNAR